MPFLSFRGLLTAFVGALLFAAFVGGALQVYVLWRWPEVEAEVLSARVERVHEQSGRVSYQAHVVVLHQANGKPQAADGVSSLTSRSEATAQAWAAAFPRGSFRRVHYDPAQPTLIRFDVAYDWPTFRLPLALWGLGLAGLTALLALSNRPQPR